MADNRNNDKKDRRQIRFDDDYFELFDDSKKEYQDIYSDSSKMEDIYSDSSKDVYIGKPRRNSPQGSSDVYIGRAKNEPPKRKGPSAPPVRRSMNPAPPPQQRRSQPQNTQPVKRVQNLDSEGISDFEARHGKKKTTGKKSVGYTILAVVLVVVLAFVGFIPLTASSIVSKFTKAEEIEHIEDIDSLRTEPGVKNILLIGADKAKGGRSRSDSMMIASVNKNTGRITIVSILRDTHLDIPGKRESKVNAAYSWGGANLLIQTIEQNFGIKIDEYATVNFDMFVSLIDGLGGIEVDVSENEADYINNRHNYKKEKKPKKVESGKNVHLSGYQALWYSRIRYLDSDFNRTERQRKVISAIMKDVKSKLNPIGIFELISTAKTVAPFIETTLTTGELFGLGTSLLQCVIKASGDVNKMLITDKLPFDDTWWYTSQWDGSSISINVDENKEMLQHILFDDYEIEEETTEE